MLSRTRSTLLSSVLFGGRAQAANRGCGFAVAANLLMVLLLFAASAWAQKAGPAHANFSTNSARHSEGPTHSGDLHRSSRIHRSQPTSFLSPFFDDFYSPDNLSLGDPSSSGDSTTSQPPPYLVGSTGGSDSANPRETHASEPLMIELRGDRYERVTTPAIDGEAVPLTAANDTTASASHQAKSARGTFSKPLPREGNAASSSPAVGAAQDELPPAVLIFRDGHSEEVRDYTIADGFLYARGDYYTDGYWNKKVDLATLDMAQTLQTNASRNTKFVLPSSPNEVITRP